MRQTLRRSEILRGKKVIEFILKNGYKIEGKFVRCYIAKELPGIFNKILFGAFTSRSISRAVDRNRLRRLIRESFRINKLMLSTDIKNRQCSAAFLFIYKQQKAPYTKKLKLIEIQNDMVKIFKKISQFDVVN